MAIVIGIMPALFWGVLPVWLQKVTGGTFRQQLIGTTIGIVFVAAAVHVVCGFSVGASVWVLFLLSGFCWSFGQAGQYYCYDRLGVSITMPLSTALQIVGNSIIGGLFFGEWNGRWDILKSLLALVLIIAGVFLTNGRGGAKATAKLRDYGVLVLTTAGYWLYSAFPLMVTGVGSKIEGFLPQALGMLISSFLIGATQRREVCDGRTVSNISGGLIFSVAAATYLMSMSMNGMVNAFVLSQLNVAVSTLMGAIILKETAKGQVPRVAVGLVVLLVGATVMVM